MKRLLGVLNALGQEQALVQDGPAFTLKSARHLEENLFLSTLIQERDLRVGNGRASGEGVFDFRYGPFTGGLAETGLLHLSTYGERILGVEIDLSVKHRGLESALIGLPITGALPLVERVCGNFSFTHAHAFALAVESASDITVDTRSRRLAIVALELERIYNHLHVISRLAEAAAQRVLAAHLGALFEEALRINRSFAGSRFLRNMRIPGAVRLPDETDLFLVARRVEELAGRFRRLFRASLSNRNYLDRLHGIAVIDAAAGEIRSLSGPSLRATGRADDLRAYDELLSQFVPVTHEEGDSLARMEVRGDEILQSCAIIAAQIDAVIHPTSRGERRSAVDSTSGSVESDPPASDQSGATARPSPLVAGNTHRPQSGIGVAEGPSGIVAWFVEVEDGKVATAYTSTPSLFGFQVFAEALTGHIFTDFPFALDSFGLSFADAAR